MFAYVHAQSWPDALELQRVWKRDKLAVFDKLKGIKTNSILVVPVEVAKLIRRHIDFPFQNFLINGNDSDQQVNNNRETIDPHPTHDRGDMYTLPHNQHESLSWTCLCANVNRPRVTKIRLNMMRTTTMTAQARRKMQHRSY